MQNQPQSAPKQQIDFVAPFAGKCGKPLQFILIGSLVFNLFFFILCPLAEIFDATVWKLMFIATAVVSIVGFYQLFSSTQVFSLKRSALLFVIAEALIAIGVLSMGSSEFSLYSADNILGASIVLQLGLIVSIVAPSVLLGDSVIAPDTKAWPVWVGVFRMLIMSALIYLFIKVFKDVKLALVLIGICNFAITYFMWMSLLAPQQLFLNKK